MLYILYFGLFFLNVLYVLRKTRSNIIILLSIFLTFVCFISERCLDGDHYYYQINFLEGGTEGSSDLLFNYLIYICRIIGIKTYNTFLAVVYLIGAVNSYLGFKVITKNYHPVLSILFIYIFPLLGIAIRFYLAISFVILALRFLYKKRYLLYLLFVIIGALFHFSVLFATLFIIAALLSDSDNERTYDKFFIKPLFVTSIILSALAYFSHETPWLASVLHFAEAATYNDRNVAIYLVEAGGNGPLLVVPIFCTCFALSVILNKRKYRISTPKSNFIISINYYTTAICLLLLPLLFVDLIFMRLLVLPTIINMITLGYYLDISQRKSAKIVFLLYIALILSWMALDYIKLYECSSLNWIKESIMYINSK